MKLFAVVIGIALFAAVNGYSFVIENCIRVDLNGTVTATAIDTKTNKTDDVEIDLTSTNVTGNCNNKTAVMTITIDNSTTWTLQFENQKKVMLTQKVSFVPAELFKNSSMKKDSVEVTTDSPLSLSSSNASYLCESQETISFSSSKQGSYSFSVLQNITGIQAQAFGLVNSTFSHPEHCPADRTTVAPTTTPTTTVAPPTPGPFHLETFVLNDTQNQPCFILKAGLQFEVEYKTKDNSSTVSNFIAITNATVTGTCASKTGDEATMVLSGMDYNLTITEKRAKQTASSTIKLEVKLDPVNFPNATDANETKTFEIAKEFQQNPADTYYVCDSMQKLQFNNSKTILYTKQVKLQAFNLTEGEFSGNGSRCSLDPFHPASTPGYNTYVVKEGNITCIVLKGEISFSNFTYMKDGKTSPVVGPINIPAINETTGNVNFNGSCDQKNGTSQQLVITFYRDWELSLTFARVSSKDSAKFYLQDIELKYYLVKEFFPNASHQNVKMVVYSNITGDFMKGSIGGSYKCNDQQTQRLNNTIEFRTTKLQYKAFNKNNSTSFGGDVTECSADDESNSIVPIAVGAALAGLVAIVLIAYLIGRRRSRRQGYESV